ncbi:MAG: bifunctional hydroxymethylpyrimidine kinase/phosphomethylpyrimidine kinase [Thermaerobacter sp.]|nr:bifunctional hydroxymethylpyrimidine kinase/phosphomethylpyrimidine kinase [Thermaerobacter sp.]
MPARILTVAGSDSGGGAGIEADIKTIERLGGYAMAAVTAVTAQNTQGVHGIWPLPPEAISRQIEVVAQDIGVDAAKCGMLGDAEAVRAVGAALRALPDVPLVVDPVMRAKGGDRLLAASAEATLREDILPLAWLVTPNLPEVEALTGASTDTRAGREEAARRLVALGARAALVKGGHGVEEEIEDLLFDGRTFTAYRGQRLQTRHTHGTGCTLSAAIATGLGQHLELAQAVERAISYVRAAIARAPGLGSGHGPLDHHAGQPAWTEAFTR